ncbi:hypothetical protein [Chryseobacterium sp. EO14]|uniref:hypothetical protein n=1 Tax=Chryseobacterium sp. EO14 TaxID=2950551 RepID=UPI00210B533B|nr:hypothetical protein [Chryseobacterium sp. EO14]MCQ4140605.1 hypothetical protein [Chryseobacterium sp. EO14]
MLNYNTQTLDKEELLLEESLTSSTSQGLTAQQLEAEKTKLQHYTVQKPVKKPISIRLLATDLVKLKSKAEMMGIPYQTFIALELHKMVN